MKINKKSCRWSWWRGVVWPAFLQFRCGTIVAYQSVSTYRRAGSERLERHCLSINELLSVQRLCAQPNLTHSFPTEKKSSGTVKNKMNSGRPWCQKACKPNDSADACKLCWARVCIKVCTYS